jgi:hypothetical protein
MQFRAEAFNLFNRPQFGVPQANLSLPLSFGVITTTVNSGATGGGTPRQFQLASSAALLACADFLGPSRYSADFKEAIEASA